MKDVESTLNISRLSKMLRRPLAIGDKAISSRLVLAPMTCLGHVALRELIADFGGCGLYFSEMCSAGRIPHENRRTSAYFRWRDAEADRLAFQIAGCDPAKMARAAARIEECGLFGVDINLGCCAYAICRQNWGAALLRQPDQAVAVVRAVRQAVSFPVTVKFRTGWEDDPRAAVNLALRLQDTGVDALTFHPRVAPDRRNRPPKWEYIAAVKDAVSIPVFGNGNVFSAADCLKMMETTGCDGVALGRLAVCRPWSFAQWVDGRDWGPLVARHAAFRLMELICRHFEPSRALRRYKRYAPYLAANFRFGHFLLRSVQNADSLEVVRKALENFFEQQPAENKLPNLNFLA